MKDNGLDVVSVKESAFLEPCLLIEEERNFGTPVRKDWSSNPVLP
jgi:hypothetical protein